MSEGVVVGGWEYVIGAYSVTAVVLVVYAGRLMKKLRQKSG